MGSVCLMCGTEGFPEWLVFCNKCQACTLHRYCLEGPIILDDNFTWLCEDCEPKKPLTLESSTPSPCRTSRNRKLEKDTTPADLISKNRVKIVKKKYGSLKEIFRRGRN